jgi:hypothetical protein
MLENNVLLKEFKDGTLLTVRKVDLQNQSTVSFGRSSETNYKIGRGVQACSRVQARLVRSGDAWLVVDGQGSKPSGSGVWFLGERIREPLTFGDGMEIDIFFGDGYRAELSSKGRLELGGDEPPTQGFEAEAIALLRRDLQTLQQELNLQQQAMMELNQRIDSIDDLKSDLQADMERGFQSISTEVRTAIALASERDQQQEDRLKVHHEHLKYLTIGLAVTMLSVCGWNATKAQEEVGKIANIAGMVASVAGLIYMRPGERGEELRPLAHPVLRDGNND